VVGNDFYFLDGIFVWSNDRSATPGDAGGADAVDLIIVFAGAGAVGSNLSAVFNLKNAIRSARTANGGRRQILRSSPCALCTVSEGSGCQLQELKWIASEGRQVLKLARIHCALKVGRFGVDERRLVAVHGHGLRGRSNFELNTYAIGLLGDYANSPEYFFLEAR